MASFSRHYTLHVTASVVMIMALPAVSVWLFLSGYTPFAMLLAILAVAVVFRLIRLLRYPISQTEMMARAIKNNDQIGRASCTLENGVIDGGFGEKIA